MVPRVYLVLLVASLLMVSALSPVLAVAGNAGTMAVGQSGKGTVQSLVNLLSSWSGEEKGGKEFVQASRLIDYPGMAEAALRAEQWNGMTAGQRKAYAGSFQSLVEGRYYRRWHRLFQKSHLVFGSEQRRGDDIFVKTYLTQRSEGDDTIVWRLRVRQGKIVIISLEVNGKDLVGRLSERFQKRYDRNGVEGLVAWIKSHDCD